MSDSFLVIVYDDKGVEVQRFERVDSQETVVNLVGATMAMDEDHAKKRYRVRVEDPNGSGYWMFISDKKR